MFVIKQNDTLPHMESQLFDHEGNPINLELCGVQFHMEDMSGNIKINRAATIVEVATGKVKVEWQQGDTDTTGTFKCEFEVNMPDGGVITVPNDGYFLISIIRELA